MASHARLKNEFTEDEKCHNLTRWLKYPKFWDRLAWANSADQDQTTPICSNRSSLIRVYMVCHSIFIFWTHYCMLKSPCSNFRIITAIIASVPIFTIEPPHDKTKQMTVHPAKTQISLGIRPVWSESSLCAQWIAKDPSFILADSEDSDQTGRMPRLIWVFAGRTCHFVGFVMRRLNVYGMIFQCHLYKETGQSGRNGVIVLPNVTAVSRHGDVAVRSHRLSKLSHVPGALKNGECVILIYVKVLSFISYSLKPQQKLLLCKKN